MQRGMLSNLFPITTLSQGIGMYSYSYTVEYIPDLR